MVTTSELYQQRLIKMGWSSLTADSFARRVANTPGVERVFAKSALHLEEMLLQCAGLRPVQWDRALEESLTESREPGLDGGSMAAAPSQYEASTSNHETSDFEVDDAHYAAALLSDLLVEPPTRRNGWVADWTGRAFHGALIEWLAGARPSGASPPPE